MTSRICSFLILTLAAGPAVSADLHVYRATRLWPGDGPVITHADLVVRDGKIVSVGKRSATGVPADAIIHDLGDAVLIPGLVVAETTVAEKGRDDVHAITPHHRAADGFDMYADYAPIVAGGVTTIQISPGDKRLVPGEGAVVKLHGNDPARRTLREVESLRVVFGDAFKNPPRIYEPPVGAVSVDRPLEPTKPQLAAALPEAVSGLRAMFRAAKSDSASDSLLKAVANAGTAAKPLRITAPTVADVQAALDLAAEFDLQVILVEPPVPAADQLAKWKPHVAGVILNPGVRPGMTADAQEPSGPAPAARTGRRGRPNPTPAPRRNARRTSATSNKDKDEDATAASPAEEARELRAAGFRVAVKPVNDADLKEMLYLGGLFTTHNSPADALKLLTTDAAAILGVGDRVGTLSAGKDADFIVLSGDPFALHTKVREVVVDGQTAYEASAAGARKVIRGARVLTGNGDAIAGGAVLIDGKTIRAVGRDVSAPADAEERRFAGAVIVPGFIDMGNGLGVGGPLTGQIPINTKLGPRLVFGDPAAATVRHGGITTVLLSGPAPSPVVAFKLGDKLRPLADPVALRFAVRGNLTTAGASLRDSLRAAKAYNDSWTKYETDLKAYQQKKKEYDEAKVKEPAKKPEEKKDEKKPEEIKDDKKPEAKKDEKKPEEKKLEEPKSPSKPPTVESLEPMRLLFAGTIPALVEAKREDAIRLAVTICRDEYTLRTILVGADDAWRVADLLAEKNVAVCAGPDLVHTVDRAEVNLPLLLSMRGIATGFQSLANSGAKNLPLAIGFAVRHGLGADDAVRGLTAGPAQFLGLGSIGTLAAGKDADLVVLSGMPFELSTRVLAVMIDGQWVYREEN
jgi:imidazolonepropionase-like amidohydrolase